MKVKSIKKHGLPDMDKLTGRVAFIFDGNIVSGWPLFPDHSNDKSEWEADSDVGRHGTFLGVEKYIIFEERIDYPDGRYKYTGERVKMRTQ